MATKKRYSGNRKHPAVVATSSSSSDSEEAEIKNRSSNGPKNKTYVKKKGEARRRDSVINVASSTVIQGTTGVDEISKGIGKVNIAEKEEEGSLSKRTNNNSREVESKMDKTWTVDKAAKVKVENLEGIETLSPIISKSVPVGEIDQGRLTQTKNVDKGETAEERKRKRQAARFAKAVARFSMKFMKAAKDLGIFYPDESSSSGSDSSSWSTESSTSCSSSCTCSDCCTTDTSTCSCSYCNSNSQSSSENSDSSSPSTSGNNSFSSTSSTSESSASTDISLALDNSLLSPTTKPRKCCK